MSALSEKLEAAQKSFGTRARATLKQLQERWGRVVRYQGATSDSLILIGMDGRQERWTRVSGAGPSALYELERP